MARSRTSCSVARPCSMPDRYDRWTPTASATSDGNTFLVARKFVIRNTSRYTDVLAHGADVQICDHPAIAGLRRRPGRSTAICEGRRKRRGTFSYMNTPTEVPTMGRDRTRQDEAHRMGARPPQAASHGQVTWHVAPAFLATVALGGITMGAIASCRVPHAAPWPAGLIGHVLDASMTGPAWLVGLVWALAIAAVVVAHEAGHALSARCVGGSDVCVHLAGLHGRTSYTLDDPWSGRRALVIAAGALAPGVFVPLVLVSHLGAFAVVGSVLLLANVVPVPVSDGGHLVALLVHRTSAGGARGQRRLALVEMVGLGVVMLMAVTWGFGWLAWLLAPMMMLAVGVEIRQRMASRPVCAPGASGQGGI